MSEELNMEAERAAFEAWANKDDSPPMVADLDRHRESYVRVTTDMAWEGWLAARRTAPVSAPLDTQALPPPKYPQMKVLIHGDQSEQCGYTAEQVRELAEHIKKLERENEAHFKRCDEMREALAQCKCERDELKRELEQAKSAFEGSEAARKDAERARGPVQSIDTPEFRKLMAEHWKANGSVNANRAFHAVIAYVDGRPSGTAPGAWKVLSEGDKPDASRLLDVILDNGACLMDRQYSKIDWTQVADWRYSAAAPTPMEKAT